MLQDIAGEFRDAPLGDHRRSARLERIGQQLALDPTRSFPDAMASEGQLEALYRFLNNDEVSFGRTLEAHARKTAEGCVYHGEVFVLHDTTLMEFRGDRAGLGRLETSVRRGFFFHTSLAVGCQFERRQLESFHSLDNALAIFLAIAVRLLALRGAARAAPSDPCRILTAQQVKILRRHTTRFMSQIPNNEEAAMALAYARWSSSEQRPTGMGNSRTGPRTSRRDRRCHDPSISGGR